MLIFARRCRFDTIDFSFEQAIAPRLKKPERWCFSKNGNPTCRQTEKETIEGKTKTRYWHAGLGCSVMVAAMYLIRAISEAAPNNQVRLFEGFISYKDRADGTDHCGDFELSREVERREQCEHCIRSGNALLVDPTDRIFRAFKVCGFDSQSSRDQRRAKKQA